MSVSCNTGIISLNLFSKVEREMHTKKSFSYSSEEKECSKMKIGSPYEQRHEKTGFACAKTKKQISFAATAKLISVFVFAT